jgi:hypothetical protein
MSFIIVKLTVDKETIKDSIYAEDYIVSNEDGLPILFDNIEECELFCESFGVIGTSIKISVENVY